MLSISVMSGGQAGYYLGLAREDYYLEGGEPPGRWLGGGSKKLGLVGTVEKAQLYNLFDGLSVDGNMPMVQIQDHRGKQDHRPGWDLTFSAPKSVSVLWSQVSEIHRTRIQDAHFDSVKSALQYLEDTSALTRRGRGGLDLEKTDITVACFEHSTSRALDPQLHTHALVLNIGLREDGTSGTLSSLSLFRAKMTAGALYRAEFSSRLEKLGIPVERHRSWFDVVGVPGDLMAEFSKRRSAIEEAMLQRGSNTAKSAAAAALETRDVKEATSRANLFASWHRDGERYNWSNLEADRLCKLRPTERNLGAELVQATARGIERVTEDAAHFTERDFLRRVAEESQARGLMAGEIRKAATRYLELSKDIVKLGRYHGEERYTTVEMLRLEERLISDSRTLHLNDSHSLNPGTVMRALSFNGGLSEEQMKAVWHLTQRANGIAVVSGIAGAGKTTMLKVAREAWEAEGYVVRGIALAAETANRLMAGSGIPSGTVARLISDLANGQGRLTDKTILVLDEAGMVPTREMATLVRNCVEAGSKLALLGDERQLQPIGPGAPFFELGERFGKVELTEIRRQNEAWARKAVKDIADGKAREALTEFASRGLVSVSSTRADAIQALVDAWRSDGHPLAETLIVAGTRKEAMDINRLAQEARMSAQELGPSAVSHNGQRFFEGDRVMFTKTSGARGLRNGTRGTVLHGDQGSATITVRLDSGDRLTVSLRDYEHVTLGYASTTHKGQGATARSVYVLSGGYMQDRELSYVQASRATESTRFFVTEMEVGDALSEFAREMERSRRKDMAHSILRAREIEVEH